MANTPAVNLAKPFHKLIEPLHFQIQSSPVSPQDDLTKEPADLTVQLDTVASYLRDVIVDMIVPVERRSVMAASAVDGLVTTILCQKTLSEDDRKISRIYARLLVIESLLIKIQRGMKHYSPAERVELKKLSKTYETAEKYFLERRKLENKTSEKPYPRACDPE